MALEAGDLDHRAAFSARVIADTDMGGTLDDWAPEFEVWAAVKYLRGGEAVMQARLASRNPVIVTVRNSGQARRITSEWRVRLRDRTGIEKDYSLREDPRPTERGAFLEFLAEG